MQLVRFHARGLFVVEQMTMIAHACPLLGRKGHHANLVAFAPPVTSQTARLAVFSIGPRAVRQQSYLIVFEATPEGALSAPLVVYALTAKYHVPG